MTVSRVVNGEGRVLSATRELVEAAVERLRYVPNRAARTLAGAPLVELALLYSDPSAAYLSAYLVGGLDQTERSDVQLVVAQCRPGMETEVVSRLIARGIDGVVLPPPLCDSANMLAALTAAELPTVLVASGDPAQDLPSISIDDEAAAHAMTAHILSLGHRRIGLIAGSATQTASAKRVAGYRRALMEHGVVTDAALVAQGWFSYRSGLDAAEELLDLPAPPTAIFASNDDMAAATVAVAHRRGMDVPGDLTVCGFDDSTLATAIWPELTTIRQPTADMSRAAITMLTEAIRGREAGRHLLLDFALVRRQSDAPPRRRPRVAAG